ncbi:SAM-dependent methyltransferase [Streptomyces sp. DSM 40907]|uniref:SAM-dependent methyltransferase n=1 Tax=Streptomyces kutzneri TaxID=3051179 RepID=UPI0028D0FE0E|nr:methyltransferase domain-containing protein [Streptomyces sp. DSM 40907]
MENPQATPPPSSTAVGEFYDHMGALFASLFGENIHLGIWDPGDQSADHESSMATAQARMTDRLIDLLHLQGGEYVLDVGCGTGHPAIRLAQRTDAKVAGVSVSSSQVATATAAANSAGLSSRLEFTRADAMNLPHPAGTFDAAWAVEMLLHVPDRPTVLREFFRTLKPGGRLVLTDFVVLEPLTSPEWDLLTQGFAFSSLLHPSAYGDVIAEAGFETVRVHDVSAQTKQSLRWFTARYEKDKERLAAHYGPEFAAQMDLMLPTAISIHTDKLGYVIAEARRPNNH